MKIKLFLLAILIAFVSYGAYLYGWYRGVGYEAVAGAIAHGNIDLMTAQAIRKHNEQEALKWAELDLTSINVTLTGFKKRPPHEFLESLQKTSSRINDYKTANKITLFPLAANARIQFSFI